MIQNLEALVRAGQFKEVLECLRKIKLSKVGRSEALAYAGIASRIGQLPLALRILNPIVRGENLLHPASNPEKIQYANLLRKLGAIPEAIEILTGIDAEKNPDVSLHLAFCHSTQWQYDQAIPYLRFYLKQMAGNPYKTAVAKVNLLAALIHEDQLVEARSLIKELHDEVDPVSQTLLLGNIHELIAQLEIKCEAWDSALLHLEEAATLLKHAKHSPDALYIEKWRAITQSLMQGKANDLIFEVKARALNLHQWETVRDCEFYLAQVRNDRQALVRLYYGTPFQSYRMRILRVLGDKPDLANFYIWGNGNLNQPMEVFDLVAARLDTGKVQLPPGQILHRLFIIFCQDFYKPAPLISLFAQLFPGEHFNPSSSPNRTHQVIKRLRQWMSKKNLPLRIDEISKTYRLVFLSNLAVRVPRDPLPQTTRELEVLRLKALVLASEFTAREAATALAASRSETQRLLQWAVEAGQIESFGFTNKARYKKIA